MICSKCGTRYADGLNFCPNCGTLGSSAGGKSPVGSPAAVPPPGAGSGGSRKRRRLLPVLLALALVVAGSAAIWIYLDLPDSQPTEEASGATSARIGGNEPSSAAAEGVRSPTPTRRPARRRRPRRDRDIGYLYLARHPRLPVFGTFEFTATPPVRPRVVAQWARDGRGLLVRPGLSARRIDERQGFVLIELLEGQHEGSELCVSRKAFQPTPPP